jgi:hypothetical protein
MKDIRLSAIALASAFVLCNASALANTARHRPSVRVYHSHRDTPPVRSGFVPSDGATSVSAGGYLPNGRSASEAGGG